MKQASAGQERRSKIIEEGVSLVSREGLAGLTLGGLAERVGMSKSGLFAHFKSKEAVQIELLERVVVLGNEQVVGPAFAAPDGLPRLRALFQNWLGWAAKAGLPGGCPMAAAAFEVDDLEGPLRDRAVEMMQDWMGLLGGLVRKAVELGHLRADTDPGQIVWEIGAIYLGHHSSQRFARDPMADLRALVAFEALIARYVPESAL